MPLSGRPVFDLDSVVRAMPVPMAQPMKVPTITNFVDKERRQIGHFFKREVENAVIYDACGTHCNIWQDWFEVDLSSSILYNKLIALAKKYNLHVRVERDSGRIWATKKGFNDAKIQSMAKRR